MTYSVIFAAPLLIAAIVSAVRFVGCTQDFGVFEQGGDEPPEDENHRAVGVLSGSGTLSAVAVFTPTHDPETASFTKPGSLSYEIPDWCNYIDVFLLGAGGGGDVGQPRGAGGEGGSWTPVPLWRGQGQPAQGMVAIPRTTTSIAITVGAGGAAGTAGAQQGAAGGDTTATAAGMSPQTASGGAGGASPDANGKGPSPQSVSLNGTTETGGADQPSAGQPGLRPGGGGAGGFLAHGGDGADGAAWVVARQT
ncbi:hypothetical protein [Mycolicibacterium hodleri]|nr:hypothetical protein [Mycolicibacterium hodleri]